MNVTVSAVPFEVGAYRVRDRDTGRMLGRVARVTFTGAPEWMAFNAVGQRVYPDGQALRFLTRRDAVEAIVMEDR